MTGRGKTDGGGGVSGLVHPRYAWAAIRPDGAGAWSQEKAR
jgi:hypothetical protein